MKKNVKILGAAAAALLAVAPVVASATTVNASTVTVNAGATTTPSSYPALNINATIDATAGVTKGSDAAKTVKLSIDNGGKINGFDSANVKIVDDNGYEVTGTLQAGKQYRVKVENVYFSNLLTNTTWNLGNAKFNNNSTPTSSQLQNGAQGNVFLSAPFYLTDANDSTQPYFSDTTKNQLPNGAVAHVGDKGEGVSDVTTLTADGILAAAKSAVQVHNGGEVTTTADDVASQLAAQKISKAANGSYILPTSGFHVTLTAVNRVSGKSVTVVVPFSGSKANYSAYPIISFTKKSNPDGYKGDFAGLTVQGKPQDKSASSLVRTINPGNPFTNTDAVANFAATTGDSSKTPINVSVLNNPVNTKVPGRYTVTIQATDWTTGKTSKLSYTVQVGESDATYQNVNYPAAYGVNVWSISGDTVSFTGNRQAGQTSVATYDTKTINGVSYTRIGSKDSNTWIQTQYLGNHSNNKPSNNGETKLNGVGRVSYNGKGAVRLLNANGHYVDQYVKKGASFKVWAEKTVNGKHLYRIGSQSQWIPAKYFSLN